MKNLIFLMAISLTTSSNAQALLQALKNKDFSAFKSYVEKFGVDHSDNQVYPIIGAVRTGDIKFVKYLIDRGANINIQGYKKRSALMYALKEKFIDIARLLIENEADRNLRDYQGQNAIDLAMEEGHDDMLIELFGNKPFLSVDGPYIFDNGSSSEVHSVEFTDKGDFKKKKEIIDNKEMTAKCYDDEGHLLFEVEITETPRIPKAEYEGIEKICVVSDIEGHLTEFTYILQKAGVIDQNYNWIFGDGHLVLLGDFFDRGKQVTEVLWLSYYLEQQANDFDGKVHFIIGNHEEMNLRGDNRYIHEKYKSNAKLLNIKYSDLYSDQTVLGAWLRTKPALVRINNILFCHAGISPEFVAMNLSIAEVNSTIREYLDQSKNARARNREAAIVFDSKTGPLYYRGLAHEQISQTQVDKILHYFDVDHIIIGHTTVDEITPLYDGKVIDVDVKHAKGIPYSRALLIEDGDYFCVGGKKRRLF